MAGSPILRRAVRLAAALAALSAATGSAAGEWDISGSVAAEVRLFPYAPAFPDQDDDRLAPSLAGATRLVYEWNGGADRLTLAPFLRLDPVQGGRSHADLREAIFEVVKARGWVLRELARSRTSLEDIFVQITRDEDEAEEDRREQRKGGLR